MKYLPILLLFLVACAASANPTVTDTGPGFWLGWWHGVIAPWTFLASFFWEDVGVYATQNNGGWYDFGFLLGVGAFATLVSTGRKNKS